MKPETTYTTNHCIDDVIECGECDGKGFDQGVYAGENGLEVRKEVCKECNGKGWISETKTNENE